MTNYSFRCTLCGTTYKADEVKYVCPKHGDAGALETVIDFADKHPSKEDLFRRWPPSMWRYLDLLPISPPKVKTMLFESSPFTSVGWTPLFFAERLGAGLGLTNLYIKD